MKKYSIVFLMLFSVFGFSQSLKEFRALLQKSESSEVYSKTLLEKSKKEFEQTNKPIYEALYAVGHFFMAKHAGNPLSKYSNFNKGKKLLENAVKRDPKNLEIRFMRYLCQEKTPKFLGYNKDLEADKKFVLTEYRNCTDEDLVSFIKKYFKI